MSYCGTPSTLLTPYVLRCDSVIPFCIWPRGIVSQCMAHRGSCHLKSSTFTYVTMVGERADCDPSTVTNTWLSRDAIADCR